MDKRHIQPVKLGARDLLLKSRQGTMEGGDNDTFSIARMHDLANGPSAPPKLSHCSVPSRSVAAKIPRQNAMLGRDVPGSDIVIKGSRGTRSERREQWTCELEQMGQAFCSSYCSVHAVLHSPRLMALAAPEAVVQRALIATQETIRILYKASFK